MKLFSCLLFLCISVSSIGQGIQFVEGDWAEVVLLAQKENKPIVVDAYTTWCGPCKWMAKTTFTNDTVGEIVNSQFIPYKMDMEKGEGIEFAKTHNVNAYPTILFFTASGELLHKAVGALGPEDFIALCADAQDPKKQFGTLKARYENGDRTLDFLLLYLNASQKANENDKSAFDEYWKLLSDEEKYTEETMNMMYMTTRGFRDMNDPYFQFFIEHQENYKESIGEEMLSRIMDQSYSGLMRSMLKIEDDKEVDQMIGKMNKLFPDKATEIRPYYQLMLAYQSKDEDKIKEAKSEYMEVTTNWVALNSEAWGVYENSDDLKELEKALSWVNRSLELNTEYANLDTKAAILYKLGKYEEAKKYIDLAIKDAEENAYPDYSDSEKLRDKIEAELK